MATVVSSSCGPCTDIARHCTYVRIVDQADGDRFGPDVVVGGQRGFGGAIVDGHPDAAVSVDSAD